MMDQLHPTPFFIITLGPIMQWCREGIADHFVFFQITECGMEFFELVKVVEDSFHDLIDDLFRGSG